MIVTPTLDLEISLWNSGYSYICGLDEVGRGCFAGPVAVGAVIFSKTLQIPKGLRDSKLLSAKQRESLVGQIKEQSAFWSIAEIDVETINQVGIGKATQQAFKKAVNLLTQVPDYLLIDAFFVDGIDKGKQKPVKNGDKLCASIAAASVIAKVYRDHLMEKLHKQFPQYNFAKNKGYGTLEHRQAIKKHGLSPLHRTSFNLGKFL